MADKELKAPQEKRQKKKKPQTWRSRLFMGLGTVMGLVFLPTTMLLMVGMMPALVAGLVVRHNRKNKVITVGSLNLAGCSPFLLELWTHGHSMDQALEIISNPVVIIIIYCAAAMGYLLFWAVSGIVSAVMYQRALKKREELQSRQKDLVGRWGEKVTGRLRLNEYGFPLDGKIGRPEK